MSMLDDSSKNFITALASKAPVPGGGGLLPWVAQ